MIKRPHAHGYGALLVALLCALLVGCQTDLTSGMARANDLLYHKDYVEAERLYRKLLRRIDAMGEVDEKTDGRRLVILERLSRINAVYLHDFNQAILDGEALLRRYPRTEQAFTARSLLADIQHHKLGNLQSAVEQYQRLAAEFPNHPDTPRTQLQIAAVYFQLKNYEQSRTEAETVMERWPESPEAIQARFQIANAYYVQSRFAEAIATYDRLLPEKLDPATYALVLFELGNCYQELGESQRALDYYHQALKEHPNPMLVRKKISRVVTRLYQTRPAATIAAPPKTGTTAAGKARTP